MLDDIYQVLKLLRPNCYFYGHNFDGDCCTNCDHTHPPEAPKEKLEAFPVFDNKILRVY